MLLALVVAFLPVQQQLPPDPVLFGSYEHLTENAVEVTNFHPEPYTGLARDSAGNLWAVNPYAGTLVRHDAAKFADPGAASAAPDLVVPTGVAPVSVAVWEPAGGAARVIAVCAGTHAAFLHDALTGAVEDVVQLVAEHELGSAWKGPISEGGDIVIDAETQLAFVSCPGTNTVLQIELDATSASFFDVVETYHLDCGQRPGPLLLDTGAPGAEDNAVLVAMTTTGNNSIFVGDFVADPGGGAPITGTNQVGRVVDLEASFPAGGAFERLPDDDVYRIVPATGAVEAWVKGAGSLLFELERNPANGLLWILAQDSHNKDARDTEPQIRGDTAANRLGLVLESGGSAPFTPAAFFDLDDAQPWTSGSQYAAATSVNQARALAFSSGTFQNPGYAFLASPLSSNIVATDAFGARFPQIYYSLPPRAQCWDLELDTSERHLLALCLGTMAVEVFDRTDQTHVASFELGLDPTPQQVRRGRDVFLDGSFSQHGRTSCATCHPGGRSDQLGWSIEGEPLDHKNVMLTQSLLSIADTFPHHWRGERDLKDFQKAFVGLLGADPAGSGTVTEEPSDAEMDDFIAFMQTLQAPANPIQNPRRLLDDERRSALFQFDELFFHDEIEASSPAVGQELFQAVPNFAGATCAFCHTDQTGSSGNVAFEVGSAITRESKIENAHLRQLQHRDFDKVLVRDPNFPDSATLVVNQNGFGMTHKGGGVPSGISLFDFVFQTEEFQLAFEPVDLMSVFRFVDQFDQGIHPGVHRAWYLDSNVGAGLLGEVEDVLIDPFGLGWCDVVVFGRVDADLGGPQSPRPVRLALVDGSPDVFVPDDPTFPFVTWDILRFLVEHGWAELVVMGAPPGNGVRTAIDFDRDALRNAIDPDPWDPDLDLDGKPDGYDLGDTTPPAVVSHELDFVTARVAKYRIRFSEDVVYRVEYDSPGLPQPLVYHSVRGDQAPGIHDHGEVDTFVLTHSNPSGADGTPVNFSVTVYPVDRNGNRVRDSLTGQEVGIPLTGFTPLGGDDQEQVHFTHVQEIVETSLPPGTLVPFGFEPFAVKIALRENEVHPGTTDFVEMVGASAFVTLGLENMDPQSGEAPFLLVDTAGGDFQTPHPTSFTQVNGGPYTGLTDYVVSPVTNDGTGDVTIVFFLRNLAPGQDLTVAVQGILRADNPTGPPPIVYQDGSLDEMQPLRLEDAMQVRIER